MCASLCIYIDIHNKISTLYSFRTACKMQQKNVKQFLKDKTKTSCMSDKSSKVSNKNKQGMLICNLRVCIYKFQNHSANWYIRSSKKVVISVNSLKMEDQLCFHKKSENIPNYKILSFETLLCSQQRQQCFVYFCKLFLCLWVSFHF